MPVTLREGEEVRVHVRLRGGEAYVTTLRLILAKGGSQVSIPLTDIRGVSFGVNKVFLAVFGLGLLLLVSSFLIPYVATYHYYDGTTCTEYGILTHCPHEKVYKVTGLYTIIFMLPIALLLLYFGYTHLWRLEVEARQGTIVVHGDKRLEKLAAAILEARS